MNEETRRALLEEAASIRREYENLRKRYAEVERLLAQGSSDIVPPRSAARVPDFRNTTWGMPEKDVREREVAQLGGDAIPGFLVYVGEVAGLPCQISYMIAEDKLCRGGYHFTVEHVNRNGYIQDFLHLKKNLQAKYGEPLRDEVLWDNDLYRDDPAEWGTSVSIGYTCFFTAWEHNDTEISLHLSGENFICSLRVIYASKTLNDLCDRWNQKQQQADL